MFVKPKRKSQPASRMKYVTRNVSWLAIAALTLFGGLLLVWGASSTEPTLPSSPQSSAPLYEPSEAACFSHHPPASGRVDRLGGRGGLSPDGTARLTRGESDSRTDDRPLALPDSKEASATNGRTPRYETRAIRDIRTGHRVMADNPELSGVHVGEAEIDPTTWRNVSLQMTKEDDGLLDVVLLRPIDWLNAYGCRVGGAVHLDLEEFGAVGPAQVLSIDPCPPIEDGPGRVVTATFAHSSADILDIHVEGLSDPIGTTANHPFWSESRQSFVAAGSLGAGEQLLLADGSQAAVLSIAARTVAEPVFNLEVDGEHAYYVSDAGVLVHNVCGPIRVNLNANDAVSRFGVYVIKVNGFVHKFGKADLNRVTKSSGLPTRLHQQVRKLSKIFGKGNVSARVVDDLGDTTTQAAKSAEHARILEEFRKTGFVPLGNWKSFSP
jgi:hypothetical protein